MLYSVFQSYTVSSKLPVQQDLQFDPLPRIGMDWIRHPILDNKSFRFERFGWVHSADWKFRKQLRSHRCRTAWNKLVCRSFSTNFPHLNRKTNPSFHCHRPFFVVPFVSRCVTCNGGTQYENCVKDYVILCQLRKHTSLGNTYLRKQGKSIYLVCQCFGLLTFLL